MLGKPSRTTFTLFEPSLISLLKTNLYKQQKQTKKKKRQKLQVLQRTNILILNIKNRYS